MKNSLLKNVFFFAVLASMISLNSCVSITALQTARVTEEGEFAYGGAIALPKYKLESGDSTTIDAPGFLGEFYGRYGINEKLDVGARVALIGTAGADVKYQFLGDATSEIAGSAGIGLGYTSISAGVGTSQTKFSIFEVIVPLYFSYHPAESFGIYLSPRYMLRNYDGTTNHLYGGVAGLRVGKRVAGFVEYGYMLNSNESVGAQRQLNIGLGIGIR